MARRLLSVAIAIAASSDLSLAFVAPIDRRSDEVAPDVEYGDSQLLRKKPVAERPAADTQYGLTLKPLSWTPLGLGIVLGLCAAICVGSSQHASAIQVDAEDVYNGQKVFSQHCSTCHMGGYNSVRPDKTLKKDALVRYKQYEIRDIVETVTKGNGDMPAFAETISTSEIKDVAVYVRRQADIAAKSDKDNRKAITDDQPGGIRSSKPKPGLFDGLSDAPVAPQKRDLEWQRQQKAYKNYQNGGKQIEKNFS